MLHLRLIMGVRVESAYKWIQEASQWNYRCLGCDPANVNEKANTLGSKTITMFDMHMLSAVIAA